MAWFYTFSSGVLLAQYWRATGAILRYTDAILACYWRDIWRGTGGAILAWYWRNNGVILGRYWRDTGVVLARYWRCTGAILARYWRDTGLNGSLNLPKYVIHMRSILWTFNSNNSVDKFVINNFISCVGIPSSK